MMEKQRHKYFKFIVPVLTAGLFLVSCVKPRASSYASSHPAPKLEVSLPGESTEQGEIFHITVETSADSVVTARFFEKEILFYPLPDVKADKRRYGALIGVDDKIGAGQRELIVKSCLKQEPSSCTEEKKLVSIKEGTFPSETLRVPPRTIRPSASDLKIIQKDTQFLRKVYASKTEEKFWDVPAVMPVNNPITSIFGVRRMYNGKVSGAHYGTDLRAPTGTPIVAPLSGKVALARKLFYTGYTVILDHGYGFFTIYGHMSKLKVKEGTLTQKGAVLGLSGATGRASGPHLHWGVHLHGIKVDPIKLIAKLEKIGEQERNLK